MAIQGNFVAVMDDIFCSPQAAANGGMLRDMVVEKLYDKIDIDRIFTLVSPIRTGDPMVTLLYPAVYNAITNTEGVDCSITACDVSPEYAAKKWAIALAECRDSLCTRELDPKFLAAWGAYRRVNPGSEEYDFLIEQLADMFSDLLANTLLAKLWLSDTTFQSVPGTAADTLDGIDGFFPQAIAESTHGIVIPAASDMTDGAIIYEQIRAGVNLYQKSKFRKTFGQSRLYIDELDALNLIGWLNDNDRMRGVDCMCIDADGVVRGDRFTLDGFTVLGLEVVPMPFVDMMEQFPEYQYAGGTLQYPHFFLIAPKEIMLVGSADVDDLSVFDYFYDRKDRTYYFDMGYSYGAMISSNHFVFGLQTAVDPDA